jgi:hypothetical protein
MHFISVYDELTQFCSDNSDEPELVLHHHHMSKPRSDEQPTGLFSGVFGFVSREIEQFVATATGKTIPDEVEVRTAHRTLQFGPLNRRIGRGIKRGRVLRRRNYFSTQQRFARRACGP